MNLFKRLYPVIFFLFHSVFTGYGQENWQKIIGTEKVDEAKALILTADGHLLVAGSTESFSQDREIWLGELDLSGHLLWQRNYNTGSFWNVGYDIIQTSDTTYFAAGSTWANNCASGQSFGLSCDLNGVTQWLKVFCTPGIKINDAYSVVQAPTGDLVFCGTDISAQSQNVAVFVTDYQGNVKWTKSLGTMGWEVGSMAIVTSDTNIVAAAYLAQTGGQAGTDAFLVKYDIDTGDTIWTHRINNPSDYDYFIDVVELSDGTLLVSEYKDSNPWLSHFDADGHLLNQKTFTLGANTKTYPTGLIKTADGGYVMAGFTSAAIDNYDRNGFLAKLSADMDTLWVKVFGGSEDDFIYDVIQMPDGGYCMVGETQSYGDQNGDIWILKTDSLGNSSEHLLRGKVFVDSDADCMEDTGETAFPNARIQISDGSQNILRLTDSDGFYQSLALSGNYTLSASAYPPYWSFCNNPQLATVYDTTLEVMRNFAAQPLIFCPYIGLDLSIPLLRICTSGKVYGQICNTGTATAPQTQVRIELDTFLTLDSATIPFTVLPNNTYLLETGSLGLFDCFDFLLFVTPDCDAPLGWFHCLDGYAYPDLLCHPDADTAFVAIRECSVNTGSYDPNDKRAFPPGEGDAHYIAAGAQIKYQVRFQNTGTGPAYRVVVLDTLSPQLDPFSFRTGVSSHPYRLEWLPGNVLKFVFDPILLPDSNANEAASHGFLNYFLRAYDNLPTGTVIENTAGIFFDHNTVVRTNTWVHTIGASNATEAAIREDIRVFPNPAQGHLSVDLPLEHLPATLQLADVLGRLRLQRPLNNERELIDLSGLESGWYNLTLFDARHLPLKQMWVFHY
ncbi:MAG: hypothetical protein ACKVT2_14485 [Saprospiraceae bacterium]